MKQATLTKNVEQRGKQFKVNQKPNQKPRKILKF